MTSIFKKNKKVNLVLITICQILFILQMVCGHRNVFAQKSTYKIHNEDLLEIAFWESPDMDRQIRVDSDGTISMPVIGNLKVVGMTVDVLGQEIITQMGMYNKLINQVSIRVLEFGQNKVHVTGQVVSPGKYSFEEMPNLWDIILEAGGPLEEAQLDEVLIVRNQEEGKIITAHVAYALKRGEVNELPKIDPGDAIHVPGTSSPFGITLGAATDLSNRNEFYILGAIGTPGVQQFENNLNLLDAIGRAGGPTEDADLEEVRYIAVFSKGTRVWNFNLKLYINNSLSTTLPIVTPGSTIFIPRKGQLSPVMQSVITSTVSAALTTIIVVALTR